MTQFKPLFCLGALCALICPVNAQMTARQPLFTLPTNSKTPQNATADPIYSQPLGSALETVDYPVAPRFIELEIEKQRVRMFYMDAATGTVGGMAPYSPRPMASPAVLLLHGKNFGGFYFENVMRALVTAGYRVVVPDQIGFGKSSKPDSAYFFDLMAQNTAKLLDTLKIDRVSVVGHSMGGMLAARFALKYPGRVNKLVLENPIGLEDYAQTIPAQSLDAVFARELADSDAAQIRAFFKRYFVTWKPEYERFVELKARQALGAEWPRVAKASALTYQMIVQQPVVGEFSQIQVPTLLLIGQEDRTVVGKNYASAAATQNLGNYPALGKLAARAIPGAKLAEFAGVGHIPHLETPEKFNSALLEFLK